MQYRAELGSVVQSARCQCQRSPIDVSTDKNVPVTFSACQSRFAKSRSIVDVSTGKTAHRSPLDVSTSVVRSMSVPAKLNRNSSFHFLAMSRPRQCRSGRNGLHRVGRVMNGHVAKWEWNRVVCLTVLSFVCYWVFFLS